MFTHPHLSSQLARERQREMLAWATRDRALRQFRGPSRASRLVGWAGQRLPRVLRARRLGIAGRA